MPRPPTDDRPAGRIDRFGRLLQSEVRFRQTFVVARQRPLADSAAIGSRYGLEAVDVETGRIRWRAHGTKPANDNDVRHVDWNVRGAADEFSICGAPLVLGSSR